MEVSFDQHFKSSDLLVNDYSQRRLGRLTILDKRPLLGNHMVFDKKLVVAYHCNFSTSSLSRYSEELFVPHQGRISVFEACSSDTELANLQDHVAAGAETLREIDQFIQLVFESEVRMSRSLLAGKVPRKD